MKYYGRKNPYTEIGIRRIPCQRCKAPSVFQWQVCANGRYYLGVCNKCDIELNIVVLKFFKLPVNKLMNYYLTNQI